MSAVRYPPNPHAMWLAQRASRLHVNPSSLLPLVLLGTAGIVGIWGYLRYRSESDEESGASQEVPPAETRSGLGMWGTCSRFAVVDESAWQAHLQSFIAPVPVIPENAEQIYVELFSGIYPECAWPPPTNVTINGMSWDQQVEQYRDSLQQGTPGPTPPLSL